MGEPVWGIDADEQDFANCEVKVYTFVSDDDDDAALVEAIDEEKEVPAIHA